MTQDKEILFPHWSFCILTLFFVIFLHFASHIGIQTNVHNITEANYWNCSFASGPMDKTSPSLIYVKWKYKKDILLRASPDIINGEERTSYRFLLCLVNLSSLFWLPFSIYLEYFSKLGMYLFHHVLENLSPPFQLPLIPTNLVSWGKHPLFLHP